MDPLFIPPEDDPYMQMAKDVGEIEFNALGGLRFKENTNTENVTHKIEHVLQEPLVSLQDMQKEPKRLADEFSVYFYENI